MKHFNLYMMGLALMTSVCATAQTHQALPHPVPGVKAQQLFKKANSSRPAAQRHDTKTTYALPTKGVRMVPLAQIAKTQRAEKADEMVKKTLLTSWSKAIDSYTPETGKITYDKYGRFSVVDYGSYKDLYTYTTDATGAKWTTKLVRRQTGDYIENLYKEERTLDANGHVTKKSIYDNRYGEKDLTLKEEYEYDYSQDPKGVEVKSVHYDLYDGINQPDNIVMCKWFAPTKSYLEQVYDPRVEKVEIVVDRTDYIIKKYSKKDRTDWELSREEYHYYSAEGRDLGHMECSYANGTIYNGSGNRTELQPDTPEAGFTTEIDYVMYPYTVPTNTWVYNGKKVYSNNYELPKTQANGDFSNKRYKYDTSKGAWVLTPAQTGTWTPEGLLQETYEEYENGELEWRETGLYKYSATGEEEGYVLPFKNGGYVIETDIAGVDGSYYTFYDKNHNVTRRLRAIYKDGKDSGSYDSAVPNAKIYDEWKNGKWVPVTTDLTIGDGANHMEVKFNAKGQMTQWDEYENGLHTEHVVYTYLNNGYIEESYNTMTNKVDEYTKVTVDAANVVTYINYEYSTSTTSSQIIWGEKYITYPTGKQVIYRWDNYAQEFVMDATTVNSLTSTAADGTETTIYREIDDNGNVVETRKDVHYSNNGVTRYETYTKVNGQWVGENKSEEEAVKVPLFEAFEMQDPVACNDEYFYPSDIYDEEDNSVLSNNTRWGWKDGKWAVHLQHATAFSQPDANTLTQTDTYIYDESAYNSGSKYTKRVTTFTKKRDSRHYLLETTRICDIVDKDDKTTNIDEKTEGITTYTYNDEGLLTSVTVKSYLTDRAAAAEASAAQVARAAATRVLQSTVVTNYYYTELDVVNGITSATADAAKPAFAVSGRTVSTVGKSAAISLYTLDGQLVATSATGHVEAPANGAFIAVSGAAKCKIVVK